MDISTKIRVAQIRAVPQKGDLQANHNKLMSILAELARESVDVVITPECFLDGYVATEASVTPTTLRQYAIDPSASPYVQSLSTWARAAAAWVIFGCSRNSPAGIFNSALILNRHGVLTGTYDKTHCQDHDKKYLPGQSLPVFNSDFGPFGVMICADRRWPETVRSLALQGARIIFNPTYGIHDERNQQMMRTRSYESEIFIAFTHPMQSLLTDPSGNIICNDMRADTQYTICEIDLSTVDAVRADPSSHLNNRRTDIYIE